MSWRDTGFTILFSHDDTSMNALDNVYKIEDESRNFLLTETVRHGLILLPDSTRFVPFVMLCYETVCIKTETE